jgi:hypothetical protein
MVNSEKKVIVFVEFNSVVEGVEKMENFQYPCAFIVGDTKYDSLGNEIVFTDEYFTTPKDTMWLIGTEVFKFGIMYVEDNFCKVNKINVK